MLEMLPTMLPLYLILAAVAYAGLAVRISRSGPQYANSMISFLMVLFSGVILGAAFSYGATDANMYSIGRVLNFFSAGFIPIAFYIIYREYTVGAPNTLFIVMLSVIPVATTALALTNSSHNILWVVTETAAGLQYSDVMDHPWYMQVYAPFVYGLVSFSAVALAGRLPSIAMAHRKPVSLLLFCGMLPVIVGVANTFFGFGPPDFPFAIIVLTLLWPFFAYLSVKVRVHEFSPLAYQTLFNHVRDPIFVIDNDQRIICANHAAQELLGAEESELIGSLLWEDFPVARAILEQARSWT